MMGFDLVHFREALTACRHMEGIEFRHGTSILQKSAKVLAHNLKNSDLSGQRSFAHSVASQVKQSL
jgi:hypothetical protein